MEDLQVCWNVIKRVSSSLLLPSCESLVWCISFHPSHNWQYSDTLDLPDTTQMLLQ